MENLYSTAERRMLKNGEKSTSVRIADFWGVITSVTGKVELVYEGEQEGPQAVALRLLGLAVKEQFLTVFEHPDKTRKGQDRDPFGVQRAYFSGNNIVEIENEAVEKSYQTALDQVPGLDQLLEPLKISKKDRYVWKELVLHALAEFEVINKDLMQSKISFSDPLANMLEDLD
jgi:magnesium chelatase subunit I